MRHVVLSCALALLGCEGSSLEASCGGNRVALCEPYEYAEPTEASFEPGELPVADFTETARIVVRIASCERAPGPHVVDLSALVPSLDGGAGLRVMSLLTLMEGRDGDVPGDGRIDVEVLNPFIATVPENSDITLRFSARSTAVPGCTGGVIELPYRTGPRRGG